jgi:hypothetical protein
MKNLSWFNKAMYSLNIILIIVTLSLISCLFWLQNIPILSVLTLFMPVFFILNGLFFIYWGFQFKKRMILSGIVLLIGITFINKFYKFSAKEYPPDDKTLRWWVITSACLIF